MSVFNVKVKWGKELFPDIELDTDEEPMVFKAQLFALTGVQPERQKIMLKGMTLKDDSWKSMRIKNGATLLMMGTKEEDIACAAPQHAADAPRFVEDMSDNELASALQMPAGLTNLGNTCYMNATVQCLKCVPELTRSLAQFSSNYGVDGSGYAGAVTSSLRDLYSSMENVASLPPIIMLNILHTALPRFAERGEQGNFMQQDANECWTELVRMLQQKLPALAAPSSVSSLTDSADDSAKKRASSLIDQYFGGVFVSQLKCTESEDESVTVSHENFLQLSCFISQEVKYLHTGLKLRLQEQITKHSSSLDRDAIYTKTSQLDRLPAYLTVQIVRFFYKEKEKVNAKILKDVKFPILLDVYDLCSEQLQQRLQPMRSKFKQHSDSQADQCGDIKNVKNSSSTSSTTTSLPDDQCLPFSFEDDTGSNNSGLYQLQAVLTHQGRSSSSGHYVAWTRHQMALHPSSSHEQVSGDCWVKFDDDTVTAVHEEDILRLSGGGDWHCAYVLLYGPRRLPRAVGEEGAPVPAPLPDQPMS